MSIIYVRHVVRFKDIANTSGKRTARYGCLVRKYYRPLVVFAESYLHDLQSAEDLVQEQMVKLWSKQTFAGIVPEALGTFLLP